MGIRRKCWRSWGSDTRMMSCLRRWGSRFHIIYCGAGKKRGMTFEILPRWAQHAAPLRELRKSAARIVGATKFGGGGVELLQHGLNFGIGLEELPDKTGAVVFDHYGDGRLVQAHVNGRPPVAVQVVGVERAVNSPEAIAEVAIEMLKGGHRSFGCVRERSEGAGGSERAPIVLRVGGFGIVAFGSVAGGESPGVGAVGFAMFGIFQ